MKFYFIIKSLFSIRFSKHSASCVCFVNSRDIVCGFPQYWHVKCNLPLTYAYCTCLVTAKICSLIPIYIVNHQKCLKKIITTNISPRNHQPRRLPSSFMLMRCRFVRCNFIGHNGRNGRESTNQLQQHIRHIETLYFLFHWLLIHDKIYRDAISPSVYTVLDILKMSPARDGIFVFLPSSWMSRVR